MICGELRGQARGRYEVDAEEVGEGGVIKSERHWTDVSWRGKTYLASYGHAVTLLLEVDPAGNVLAGPGNRRHAGLA